MTLNGENTLIGLSDSGIDTKNCYFFDQYNEMVFNKSDVNFHRKVPRYNDYIDNFDSYDGHGTHIASVIAGELDNDVKDDYMVKFSVVLGDFL